MPELKDVQRYEWDTFDYRLAHALLGDRADHKDVKLIREFRRQAEARVAMAFQDWMDNLPSEPSFEEIVKRYTKHATLRVCPSCGADDIEQTTKGGLSPIDDNRARCHSCRWVGIVAELKTVIRLR